ncbi:MAG: NAD-dependent epimerase/dehydratase family protein, partial [Pseudomonadota bacterium]|nr:NAD-dependent epimerase/dehydratase family protein [Pseudomonadota bacterium]
MTKFKKKKILITGGLGFTGSNFAHQLVKAEAEVTILDINDPKSGSNIFNIKSIESEIELIKKDITNYKDTLVALKNKDIVFNCAASTSHSVSMKEPWHNLKTNSLGVLNLLESLRELNSETSFVHVGTTTQIGALHYNPADEFHPEFPRDIYSANKVVGEKYVLLYSRAYGLRGCVVRLPNVYGPRAAIHSPDFTFNNFFIGLALLNKDIEVYKPGTQLRNCIYV